MSGVETFGGRCPNCGGTLLQKADSGSAAFMFDACLACGFAYGAADDQEMRGSAVWEAICAHHGQSRAKLAITLAMPPTSPEGKSEIWPSVFDYSKDSPEELRSCLADPSVTLDFERSLDAPAGDTVAVTP